MSRESLTSVTGNCSENSCKWNLQLPWSDSAFRYQSRLQYPCGNSGQKEINTCAFGAGALTLRPQTIRELTLGSIKYWELTQRKPFDYKTQHHPTTNSTLCRTPHLNNKQNKNTNPITSRQDCHLTQACPSEEKQINKNSAQISPYTKLIQTTGPTLGGQKPKRRKNSTLKPGKRRPQTQ